MADRQRCPRCGHGVLAGEEYCYACRAVLGLPDRVMVHETEAAARRESEGLLNGRQDSED